MHFCFLREARSTRAVGFNFLAFLRSQLSNKNLEDIQKMLIIVFSAVTDILRAFSSFP